MKIEEYKIEKFPVVIFTDSHTNLSNIKKLKELYPDNQFFSLGDFTYLFSKVGEKFNDCSIQYFIDNKIPALEGNHESFLVAAEENDEFGTSMVLGNPPDFNLSKEHLQYLKNLPRGFRLVLPNGYNYYCFHNEPFNLWNFPDKITEEYLKEKYDFDAFTIGIIQGHLHINHVDNFNPKRIVIGQLCNNNHHTGENNGGNYALLTDKGIEFKKL